MDNKEKFVLLKEQVDFLRAKYLSVPIVQRILAAENDLHFEVSVDDSINFWRWLDTGKRHDNGRRTGTNR